MAGVVGAAIVGMAACATLMVTARAALVVSTGAALVTARAAVSVSARAALAAIHVRCCFAQRDALGLFGSALGHLVGMGRLVAGVDRARVAVVLGVTCLDDFRAIRGSSAVATSSAGAATGVVLAAGNKGKRHENGR